MTHWLCDLGRCLSAWAYLDLTNSANSDGRLQLSEVGISHVLTRLIWAVASARGHTSRVSVREFDKTRENETGADLELWLTDGALGFAWIIQAKRLYTPQKPTDPPQFDMLLEKYSASQRNRLIRSAHGRQSDGEPIAPVYWLYTFDPTGSPCHSGRSTGCRCGASDPDAGILVIPAERVRTLMHQDVAFRASHHRLARHARTLSSVLCAVGSASGSREPLQPFTGALDAQPRPAPLPDRIMRLIESPSPEAVELDDDRESEPVDQCDLVVIDVRE